MLFRTLKEFNKTEIGKLMENKIERIKDKKQWNILISNCENLGSALNIIHRDEKYIIKLNGYFNHKLDELEFYLITYINEAQKGQ